MLTDKDLGDAVSSRSIGGDRSGWIHKYTRVTEVLSILNNYADVPQEILDSAARRGTQVHDAISGILSLDRIDELYRGYLKAFHEWEAATTPTYLHKELRLFDDSLFLTGCVDSIAMIQGKVTLIDYKTSSKFLEESYSLQMNAYVRLAKKNGISIERILIVMLGKDGRFKAHPIEVSGDLWAKFLALLTIFRSKNGPAKENH